MTRGWTTDELVVSTRPPSNEEGGPMLTSRLASATIGAAILAVAATASAEAVYSSHRTTYVTFRQGVALPGVELAAGTYVFELAAPEQHTNLVRVLSRDRKKIYLTQFTLQVQRPAKLDPKRAISFHEGSRGASPSVNTWFPEHEDTGRQFIYR
jgi:hypothetical protein